MARHIWLRKYQDFNITLTSSGTILLTVLRNIADTSTEGIVMKNIKILSVIGNVDTVDALKNSDHTGGITGLFKWPYGETPTISDIDVTSSSKVFAARTINVVGEFPSSQMVKWKQVNVKPGESLWHFTLFNRQSSAGIDMYGQANVTYNYRTF